jgi:hypothetical protein
MAGRVFLARAMAYALFIGVAGLAAWTLGAEPPRQAAPPNPVRWSPELDLDSLDHIDAKFAALLPLGEQFKVNGRYWAGGHRAEQIGVVKKCGDAFGSEIWYAAKGDERRLDDFLAVCFTVHRLHWARPAAHSFVRDMPSDGSLLDVIPANVILFQDSDDMAWRLDSIDHEDLKGISLADYMRRYRTALSAPVRTPGATAWSTTFVFQPPGLQHGVGHIREFTWKTLALADFNDDGLEDTLVLLRDLWVQPEFPDDLATNDSFYLFTRSEPGKPLRVLEDFSNYVDLRSLPPLPAWQINSWIEGNAPSGLIPPRWASTLGLATLGDVEPKLARPIWPDDPEGLEVVQFDPAIEPEDRNRATMHTCLDQMRLLAERYEGQNNPEHKLFIGVGADCAAIAAMRDARASKVSHIANFRLDAAAPRYLPPVVESPINYEMIHGARVALRARTPWRGEDWPDHMTVESDRETTYEDREQAWATRVELLARADFDGDGVEDLMVATGNWATEGTYGASDVLILTRFSENEVFRVLSDWACPECLPDNPWPADAPPESGYDD